MSVIRAISALEILDSRGRPTVEAQIALSDGSLGIASVPSGASTGRHEAVELRDGDAGRYGGRGVQRAVRAVEEVIAPALIDRSPVQSEIDETLIDLDGTADKSRLGANALLAVSLATARAAAAAAGVPLWRHLVGDRSPLLPLPMVNIVSGGLHAGRQLDFQDFLVMPLGARSYSEALEMCVAVYAATAGVLAAAGYSTLKADEGGFGPAVSSHHEALALIQQGIEGAGLTPGSDMAFALDVAATHFFDEPTGMYRLASERRDCDAQEMSALVAELAREFPIVSVEDALAEDDWNGWVTFTRRLGDRLQIVGDDLFTTNLQRLERGIELERPMPFWSR